MIAKLSAAKGTTGYDICVPTHSNIQQMATAGLLTELDHSKLPNMKNLDAKRRRHAVRPRQQVQRLQGLGLDGLRLRHHRHQAGTEIVG